VSLSLTNSTIFKKMFRTTPVPKLNHVPENGVSIAVMLTKIKVVASKTGKQAPTHLWAIPLNSKIVQAGEKKKKKDAAPDSPETDTGCPKYEETISAFNRNEQFKMFNCPISSLSVGGIYRFTGVTLNAWDREHPESKVRSVSWTPDVAQVIPDPTFNLTEAIHATPFAQRSIIPEVDFFNPLSDVPYSVEWDLNKGVCFELTPFAQLTQFDPNVWFPGQLNETIVARLPESDCIEYMHQPDTNKPEIVLNSMGGLNKTYLQIFVNQKDAFGSDTRICLYTKIFQEAISFIQLRNWKILGPKIVPHLSGYLVGTMSREKTKENYSCDLEKFSGAVFAYCQFSLNLRKTLESASKPGRYQCCLKISVKVAKALVAKYLDRDMYYFPVQWSNALNLCAYLKDVNLDTLEDACSFYVVANYPWTPKNVASLLASSDDDLIKELTDAQNFTDPNVCVEVFVTSLDDTPIEQVIQNRKISVREKLFKASNPAAAVVTIDLAALNAVKKPKLEIETKK
jgi:hypothetical protein